MSINYTEQRQHSRRVLKMPLAFLLKEKSCDIPNYFFGWTKDVSSKGVCIHAKSNHIPIVDSQITLLVTPEMHNRFSDTDISVQIKGQVAWNDSLNQSFGVRFI